jgi:hypothetical protein
MLAKSAGEVGGRFYLGWICRQGRRKVLPGLDMLAGSEAMPESPMSEVPPFLGQLRLSLSRTSGATTPPPPLPGLCTARAGIYGSVLIQLTLNRVPRVFRLISIESESQIL